jgi:hypothetical protein
METEEMTSAPSSGSDSELSEYVVTLKNKDDLDIFYEDMETPGGDLYIPNRAVEVANRREISRNTHYYLTKEEADQIRNDARVLDVQPLPETLSLKVRPSYTQTSSFWDKSTSNTNTHKNWALLRSVEGAQRSNWGSNGTPSQTGTININETGRNVDVVIVDGHIDPTHPEYAVNEDGTGGSRVVQYNWFQHNPTVTGGAAGTYAYTPYSTGFNTLTEDNNHGAHVAGTACGNTQGWARGANIYNISPYGSNPNSFSVLYLFDYIRAFHNSKTNGNPTICNNSWGYGYEVPIANITSYTYRGVTTSGTPSAATLAAIGLPISSGGYVYHPGRYPALDADVEDAIADGIIMVGAASNDYMKVDVPGGLDYNNYYTYAGFQNIYYHQGSSPTAAEGAICVGAVGNLVNESKAQFSNCGSRVDIYAPGQAIMSSVNSTLSFGGTTDPRNASYSIVKIQGTSMASPQVCGVLACVLETYRTMTNSEALEYITRYSKTSQMTDTGGGYTDYTSLQGSQNRYLFFYKERQTEGNMYPKVNYRVRKASGVMYPRTKIRRAG